MKIDQSLSKLRQILTEKSKHVINTHHDVWLKIYHKQYSSTQEIINKLNSL